MGEPKVIPSDKNRNINDKNISSQNVNGNANGSMIPTTVSVPGTFESPNKIISTFFEQKGTDPLTQVEYEGIVSLINKSKNNESFVDNSTFVDVNSMKGDNSSSKRQPGNTNEQSDNFTNSKCLRIPPQSKNRSISVSTDIYNTLYNQRTLKVNNSAVFSTPDYTPAYHTISNTTMPSVKRVYQFSGLPSPYKTRIRPPATISKKPNGNTTIGSIAPVSHTPTTKRLRSTTANTLLSILDNGMDRDDVKRQKNNEEIAPFVNPYKANNKKKRTTITANDIKNTMSFDTSEKLGDSEGRIDGPAKHVNNDREEKQPQPSDATTKPDSVKENNKSNNKFDFTSDKNDKPIINTTKPTNTFSFAPTNNGTTANTNLFNFGPITVPTTTTSNGSEPQQKSTIFTNTTATTTPAVHSKSLPDTKNIPSILASGYVFPKVEVIQVSLDEKKAEGYVPLFRF
jgi:nucleoporin NUP60